MLTDIRATSILSERVNVGPSAIVGFTALAGQMGMQINPVSGGTLVISGQSVGSSFWGGYAAVNGALPNFLPMAGTFYASVVGATCVVDITRFFKG